MAVDTACHHDYLAPTAPVAAGAHHQLIALWFAGPIPSNAEGRTYVARALGQFENQGTTLQS